MSHSLMAELAELSPIIIQNSSNPSSQKNLSLRHAGKKKLQAPLLGLVKSICYLNQLNVNLLKSKLNTISVCTNTCRGTTWMDILTNIS